MGDNLSPEQRRRCMSRVRNRDTDPERRLRSALHRRGLRFRKHARLPGSPDVVFASMRVAVFVDGDFWHGYDYEKWRTGLSDFWREKIDRNRQRDATVDGALHAMGWRVMRLWEHDVKHDLAASVARILDAVGRPVGAMGTGDDERRILPSQSPQVPTVAGTGPSPRELPS